GRPCRHGTGTHGAPPRPIARADDARSPRDLPGEALRRDRDPLHPARGRVREPMTASRKSPAPRPARRSGRAWHRCVWIFAVLGVGLVVAWLILRGVRSEERREERV